jgi:uncharacterized protein (TIGR02453 family)
MPKPFAGFSPKAITFLKQLKKNNSRDWFTPRKESFEALLRNPMLELTGLIAEQMKSFAVDYVTEPAKAVHRIYRDVRFSKDKAPYKTNISAMFRLRGLPKLQSGGFYFSLSAENVEIAGGVYMPGPPELAAIRKAIAANPADFKNKIEPTALVKLMGPCRGESLTRPPRGYEQHDEPAQTLLRRKQFYYFQMLDPELATKPGLDRQIVKCFRAMAPAIEYLNQILIDATQTADDSPKRPRRPEPMF